MISNTRAVELFRQRIVYAKNRFAELVLWHWGRQERRYAFAGPEQLLADFQRDSERWNHENGHA